MAVPALQVVPPERTEWPALREQLDSLVAGKDPYVVRMWREALMEADGVERGPHCDPLAFPYIPFLPEQFGLLLSSSARVLDVGCLGGFGLFDFAVHRLRQGRSVPRLYGLDVDRESLGLGTALARTWAGRDQVVFTRATGETLPYDSGAFDMVVARSVLQYLRIRPAVAELARVARPGGLVLIQVHQFGYYVRQILRHLSKPLQAAYYGRALLSGVIFSAACLQPRHRWFREAAVTDRRLISLCRAVGLELIWSNRAARRPLALFVKV
jgi:SAM-dependent methyltransferase